MSQCPRLALSRICTHTHKYAHIMRKEELYLTSGRRLSYWVIPAVVKPARLTIVWVSHSRALIKRGPVWEFPEGWGNTVWLQSLEATNTFQPGWLREGDCKSNCQTQRRQQLIYFIQKQSVLEDAVSVVHQRKLHSHCVVKTLKSAMFWEIVPRWWYEWGDEAALHHQEATVFTVTLHQWFSN